MAGKKVKEKFKPEVVPGKGHTERDYIFECILNDTINESTPCKMVNVAGFRRFSLMGRFEGKPDAPIRFEVNQNNMLNSSEIFNLNVAGWYNFSKVYDVFAPEIDVVIYEFPPDLNVRMFIYAAY
jgi:hypothetical protein